MGGREDARAWQHFKAGFKTFLQLSLSTQRPTRRFLDLSGFLGGNFAYRSGMLGLTTVPCSTAQKIARHLMGSLCSRIGPIQSVLLTPASISRELLAFPHIPAVWILAEKSLEGSAYRGFRR